MEFTIVRNLGTKIYAKSNVTVTDEVSVSANNPDWYEEYRFKLKKCYMEKLLAAFEFGNSSIAFTLRGNHDMDLSKEEELRIAADVISDFNPMREMKVYLVSHGYGYNAYDIRKYRNLSEYLRDYIRKKSQFEDSAGGYEDVYEDEDRLTEILFGQTKHLPDTFSEYLLYLIEKNHMKNSDVYKNAIVDKKTFSKIKNNPDYHPDKITALCLCVGACLNIDETRDLLGRAGYALSPCSKTDIVFEYFIKNGIYDMIELDIQLEELGLPCLIS